MNHNYNRFWMQAALYAMQGIQEAGHYVGIAADFEPSLLAKKSFDIADAMVKELEKRITTKCCCNETHN